MKCFGKNNKSFSKTIKEGLTDSSSTCPSTTTSQRAQFRKSKLTDNTDSGLYSDESGPEDRPRKIYPEKLQIKDILTPPTSDGHSSPSTPYSLLENRVRYSQTKTQTPDSWYQPSPLFSYNQVPLFPPPDFQQMEFARVKGEKDLNLESPKSLKSVKPVRSLSLNKPGKKQLDMECLKVQQKQDAKSPQDVYQNQLNLGGQKMLNDNPNRFDLEESPKRGVVKINREAFERLNIEYLSEYDSEDEMEKTLAECIAMDEIKKRNINMNLEHSTPSNRSSTSSAKLCLDKNLYKADEQIKNEATESLYSEVLKIKDAKIKDIFHNSKEIGLNGSINDKVNFQCHLQRQKTLQSLHGLLDQVDILMNRGNKPFKTSQIVAMKDLCNTLTDDLTLFEKLGDQSIQNNGHELANRENVNKCVKSLKFIKNNILNYSKILDNFSSYKKSEQIFSTSVASILNYTKNIPDLIRSLDHSISNKSGEKSVEDMKSVKINNSELIVFNHDDGILTENTDSRKSAKPLDLDLVQNINDSHIYDEVAIEPTSPCSKAILNELNFMISELTSTPFKDDVNNKIATTIGDDPPYERISLVEIELRGDKLIKTAANANKLSADKFKICNSAKKIGSLNVSRKLNFESHNKTQINSKNNYIEGKATKDAEKPNCLTQNITKIINNENNLVNSCEVDIASKDTEKGTVHSAASLLDLETKFANMLNMLFASKDSLPNHEAGPKQLNKSLNDLKEINTNKVDPKNGIDESTDLESVSIHLFQSVDLNMSTSSLGIFPNARSSTPIIERKYSHKLMNFSLKSELLNNEEVKSNNRDTKKHLKIIENLKAQHGYRQINQFDCGSDTSNCGESARESQLSNQLDFYSVEISEHWKVLITMSNAFFAFIDQLNQSKSTDDVAGPQGPAILMSYVKLVIQAGHTIVQVTDMLLSDVGDEATCLKVEALSEALCLALKDIVQKTKDATNYFRSIPHLQSLVDSVKIVADKAGDMRAALNRLRTTQ